VFYGELNHYESAFRVHSHDLNKRHR